MNYNELKTQDEHAEEIKQTFENNINEYRCRWSLDAKEGVHLVGSRCIKLGGNLNRVVC